MIKYKKKVVNDLAERWGNSGIENGDILLLHSNAKRLIMEFKRKKINLEISDIIDSFLRILGKNGTLIMPLFNFKDFIRNNFFSIKKTVSGTGLISEKFRTKYNVLRTKHPIYSFAVYGKEKIKFKKDNFSAFGKDSPLNTLTELNGKIAILDLSENNSMTYYHYIEEMHNINWRYHKIFSGTYEDEKGFVKKKEYSVFVRDLKNRIITNVNPVGEILWEKKIYNGSRPFSNTGLRVAKAREIYDLVSEIINKNQAKGILYDTSETK